MRGLRRELIDALWRGFDPFAGFPEHLYEVDLQGWGESHPYLTDAVVELHPRILVEVGVWKGASVIKMASKLKELGIDGVIIAVDTWLGSYEHWLKPDWFADLACENGRPALQKKFMNNIVAKGLTEYVVPLPLDSLNAAQVLTHYKIEPDLLHLDGGHDHSSVMADLSAWWPLIRPGGMLIGDDYNTNGEWPEVRQAFDEYFGKRDLSPFEFDPPKCKVRKPGLAGVSEMRATSYSDLPVHGITLGAPASGDDDLWQLAEGTSYRMFRWTARNRLAWIIKIPDGPPATLNVKIPFAMEVEPDFAARSAVTIDGNRADVHVADSAILARITGITSGLVAVDLTTPEPEVPAQIRQSPDTRKLGLAIWVAK